MNKKTTLSLIFGTIVSGGALYFSFKNVPFSDLIGYLGTIRYVWVIPSLIITLITFILRSIRWQVILSASRQIGFFQAFHPLMIGFMLNCILPGRAGEFARPLILHKNEQVPFSTGLATVATERVFDLFCLIILFIAVFSTVNIDPGLNIAFGEYRLNRQTLETIGQGMIKLSAVMVAGMLMVSFGRTRRWINAGIMGVPSFLFSADSLLKPKVIDRVCRPLVEIVEKIASGFELIKSPSKLIVCCGYSAVIWVLSALTYYTMSRGCPGIDLSFIDITAYMVITCFFIALPSVPGYWGLWEAGGMFALTLFNVDPRNAMGYTLTNHALQIFPVVIVGLMSAMVTGVKIFKLQTSYEKG